MSRQKKKIEKKQDPANRPSRRCDRTIDMFEHLLVEFNETKKEAFTK